VTENILGISSQVIPGQGKTASTTYYTRAPDGTLLGERTPNGNYYYVADANDSAAAITNSTGALANTYTYDPYGTTTSSTGTAPNSFGFDGGFKTQGGLYLFGARYYDPAAGSWLQPDPQIDPTDPTHSNPYAFVGGDPVNATDPTGLWYRLLSGKSAIAWGGAVFAGAVFGAAVGGHIPGWLDDVITGGRQAGRLGHSELFRLAEDLIRFGWAARGAGGIVSLEIHPVYAYVTRKPVIVSFTFEVVAFL
jgi:RHS repeat-associated protein